MTVSDASDLGDDRPDDPAPRTTTPSTRTHRRRWRVFGLRALMMFVLVLGGGLGWLAYRERVQRMAVAAIEAAGGKVAYDWEYGSEIGPAGIRPARFGTKPPGPKWLYDAVGPHYLGDVVDVRLGGAKADESVMAHVGRLGRLMLLDLKGADGVTDSGLVHLRRLREITSLDLASTGATGACLTHLAGMSRMAHLHLPDTGVTDSALAQLEGLTALERLESERVHEGITDAGMAHLARLVNLKLLELHSPRITSRGLVHLRGMSHLIDLNLRGTAVDDLSPIRGMVSIKQLTLDQTPIDDAGIAPVSTLPHLTYLYLASTRVTDSGLSSIGELRDLRGLRLSMTGIGDQGLTRLAGLDKLKGLAIQGTRVTEEGITRLAGLKSCSQLTVSKKTLSDAGLAAAKRSRPALQIFRFD